MEMGWLNETGRRTPITSRVGVNLTMGVAGANDGVPVAKPMKQTKWG